MVTKVLCVAEKPSIAKAVANHLSGGSAQTVSTNQKPKGYLDGTDQISEMSLMPLTTRTSSSLSLSRDGASVMWS